MQLRRFLMECLLASHKDTASYNLGESGMPNISVRDLLHRCGENLDSLGDISLKDYCTRGSDRLRQAIAQTYQGTVHTGQITVTTGTSEALYAVYSLYAKTDRRDCVVAPFPSFQALYEVPRSLGANVRFYRLDSRSGFCPDPDEVCDLIDDRTSLVVINTPHNPTGVKIPDAVAAQIIDRAAEYGAKVVADEHYRLLPIDGEAPIPTLARPEGNVLVGDRQMCR